ncbi:MAG: hypothetical protein AB4368_04750 [Xenococcaceae cyanobacterium]
MSKTKPILNQSSVKNFATSTILDAFAKSEQDNLEIGVELKNAIAEIIEMISLIEADNDSHITAGIEGILEGILIRQRGSIESLKSQIEHLQIRLNKANRELQQQIELVFQELENISQIQDDRLKKAINNALVNIDR